MLFFQSGDCGPSLLFQIIGEFKHIMLESKSMEKGFAGLVLPINPRFDQRQAAHICLQPRSQLSKHAKPSLLFIYWTDNLPSIHRKIVSPIV